MLDVRRTETLPPRFTYTQGNCPEPCLFRPFQYVIDGRGSIGCVRSHYTTEECGHPEPYQHIYEVSLAGGGSKTYYESELYELKYEKVER